MKRAWLLALAAVVTVACGPTAPPATPQALQPSPASAADQNPSPHTATTHNKPLPLLRRGSHGVAVLRAQHRLEALGYWLGTADGIFGGTTQQAVYALQKAAGIKPDGVIGRKTLGALARGVVPRPRSRAGHVVEIDLHHDLLLIVDDGVVTTTLNTSTGGGYTYVVDGVAAVARTPAGRFHIYSQIDGVRISRLGVLWRPKYFYQGYAIHGSPSVPPVPASHGCVRLTNAAIDWVWAADVMPMGTDVWIYS